MFKTRRLKTSMNIYLFLKRYKDPKKIFTKIKNIIHDMLNRVIYIRHTHEIP